ncbi:alkaline shock response membrane anchor protein AmaP [Streptomyces gilvosporeus]|uniref:Alkaline shock response membrane anchor protein AmaP n=1 Tax=Streptomyces gilvosporeus TaxID=553510 RepID=A0A1V0TP57_9ACTN|nr:alkaline shock response membrane anchor protein AmaP [Streptomyces gilvosporeus]ARF54711.1 hypothetical protein B1H19_11280 [Streptomyces gilvosporeus]
MRTVRRGTNRVLLGLIGAVLLATGGAVLVAGLDLPARWHFRLPGGWPWTGPGQVLLSEQNRTRWTDRGWWWPAVIAALAVLVLLALWWLVTQLRRRRLGEILVDSGDGEGAVLRGRALEAVLTAETEALEGVDGAGALLTGRRRTQPRVIAVLALAPHADPGTVVRRFAHEAVTHARVSAGLDELPAEVRLRGVRHRAERVG